MNRESRLGAMELYWSVPLDAGVSSSPFHAGSGAPCEKNLGCPRLSLTSLCFLSVGDMYLGSPTCGVFAVGGAHRRVSAPDRLRRGVLREVQVLGLIE